MYRRHLLIVALGLVSAPADAQGVPAAAASLNGQHPAAYYVEAWRLFQAGQRDDAVFVFYLGQLRFRTHLAARPNLPRDQDPAIFAALSESVGRPINEYAFGDMPALLRCMNAELAFDRQNPDRFTDPATFPDPTRRTREGMGQFRASLAGRVEEIRRTRTQNGLENR